MKTVLAITLSSLFLIVSCKSKTSGADAAPLSAPEFYQKVIDLEETMSEPLLTTEAAIKARGDKQDFAGIAKAAHAMEDTIDVRIKAVKDMPAIGHGGEDFKTMVTRYFEYIKSIYTAYRSIGEAKTEEDRTKAAEAMTKIINVQPDVLTNLQAEQSKYAANNKFTIDAK